MQSIVNPPSSDDEEEKVKEDAKEQDQEANLLEDLLSMPPKTIAQDCSVMSLYQLAMGSEQEEEKK